ncbi:MAG: hypothetical protein EBT63_04725 [Proteobacteria bacterium]|jgi:hypothetical protein|nr:hypothetical protein [Pseudomonadota bacterium]NCA28319.1 hypothetical protein [Pseudomonadota bacterium]
MNKYICRKILFNITAIISLALTSYSCTSRDKYDNEELYNSVGFDPGTAPKTNQNPVKISPDYYYKQAQVGMGQQPQYQPPYQPQPQYQNPPYPSQYYPPSYSSPPYQVYPNAGSRFYSNPYAIPPSPYYQQYDVDQYYVPPTYSYGMEQSGINRNPSISR